MKVCPECGKECWDNVEANNARAEVGEKLRPDYACKDKDGCGWIKWRPKDGSKEIIVETFKGSNKPPIKTSTAQKTNGNKDEYLEGKKDNARSINRTNLMCKLIEVYGETNEPSDIKVRFQEFWSEIEK